MSQDSDGSGLISLLWGAWLYWNVYWWLEHSLMQVGRERLRKLSSPSIDAGAISPLSGTAIAPNIRALVSEILRRDRSTAVEDFLNRWLIAYETTVVAFDSGDRETLRKLVSPEVYDAFSDVIAAREARQESTETVFSRVDPPEIIAGLIDETHMEVSIRFVSESFRLSRNASGQLSGGTPKKCDCVDIWTIGRMLSSPDSEWRIVATEAGV